MLPTARLRHKNTHRYCLEKASGFFQARRAVFKETARKIRRRRDGKNLMFCQKTIRPLCGRIVYAPLKRTLANACDAAWYCDTR